MKSNVEGTFNSGITKGTDYVTVDHAIWKNVVAFETYKGIELTDICIVGTCLLYTSYDPEICKSDSSICILWWSFPGWRYQTDTSYTFGRIVSESGGMSGERRWCQSGKCFSQLEGAIC